MQTLDTWIVGYLGLRLLLSRIVILFTVNWEPRIPLNFLRRLGPRHFSMTCPYKLAESYIERDIRRVRWEEALNRCLAWTTDGKEEKEKLCPDETDRTTAVIPPGLFFLGTALLVIIADKLKAI